MVGQKKKYLGCKTHPDNPNDPCFTPPVEESNRLIQPNEEQEEQKITLYPSTPAYSRGEENNGGEKADVFYILKENEVFRGIKVRLYPTKGQKKILEKTFGCNRFVYNKLLEERQVVYQQLKNDKTALHNYKYVTPAGLKYDYPFLMDVDSSALSNAQMNLKSAFNNFFKHGTRYPKFKSRKNRQSYTTSNTNNNCKINFSKRLLKLPKIKTWICYRDGRIFSEKIKIITVSKSRSGKFYASMLIVVKNDVAVKNVINRERIVGFDMSAKDFVITKEFRLSNPRFYRKEETKLKRLHRELSRKKKKFGQSK